jgi:hypothetical protein
MWDLVLIIIFINHTLYVGSFFSHLLNMGSRSLPFLFFFVQAILPSLWFLQRERIALEEARQEVESSLEDSTVEIRETPKNLKTILWKFFNMLSRTFSTNFHHTKSLRYPLVPSPPTHLSQTQFSTKKSSFNKEAP